MRTIAILLTLAGSCSGFEITLRGRVFNVRREVTDEPVQIDDTFEFTYVASEHWMEYRTPWQTMWHFDIVDMYGRTFNDRGDGWIEWTPRRLRAGGEFRFTDNMDSSDELIIATDGDSTATISLLTVNVCDETGCEPIPDHAIAPSFLLYGESTWLDEMSGMHEFRFPDPKRGCGNGVWPMSGCINSVDFKWPEPGDANQDFSFDEMDIVQVADAGKYSTAQWATWGEGDWTGDGLFDNLDIVAALSTGNYNQGAYAAAVPEPSTVVLLIVCMAMLSRRRLR